MAQWDDNITTGEMRIFMRMFIKLFDKYSVQITRLLENELF